MRQAYLLVILLIICTTNQAQKEELTVGFDGVIGAEYRFYTVPLTIAIDFKPYMEFFGKHFFNINLYDFGLTLKYRIN